MEMVLVLVMVMMQRPPPTPRRRGDDDDDDFPLLRSSGAAGSDPPRMESGVSPPPRPWMVSGKLGRNFSGRTKASIKSPRRGGARGPTQWVPRVQVLGPRGPTPFGPRGSPLFGLLPSAFLPMKNLRGIFPFIIWVFETPETIKTRKGGFSASQILNAKNGDFV